MSKKRSARILEVINTTRITPNLHRITLGGADMEDFPDGHESANFKLLVPRDGREAALISDDEHVSEADKPVVRTYTVRKFDAANSEVDVEFALHEGPGPATGWAISAKAGDKVGFKGPGKPKLMNTEADWYLLAGDMSALPAISALLETLPVDAVGKVILEVISEEDRQDLTCPTGMEIAWLINPHPNTANTVLSDAVMNLPWQEGQAAVWIAGESHAVRVLRKYCKNERGLDKDFLYASGYWQIGLTEDKHQLIKRQEQD